MLTLIIIIILLSAFPIGYLLAYLTREELVSGRKYFLLLIILSLVASLIVAFLKIQEKLVIILALFYICIVALISLWKSYTEK